MDVKMFWKMNGARVMTGMGVLGVVGTAITAAHDTPKALKLLEEKEEYKIEHYGHKLTKMEKVLAVLPAYIPTILMGAATAGCVLGANYINEKTQASILAAYTQLHNSYALYQHKVQEIFGEEAEKKVREELEKDVYMHAQFGSVDEKRLFYDEYSNRYFETSLYEFQRAVYEFNRIYNHLGEISLNDFYEFFELDPIDLGNKIGWNGHKDWECRGFSWIEVHLVEIETPDNLQAFGLIFNVEPNKDFKNW